MENIRTIAYDDKTAGRKIITFPPVLPFVHYMDGLIKYRPQGNRRNLLEEMAEIKNIYERSARIADYLSASSEPQNEILRIAAMAGAGEEAGLRLMYAVLLAIPRIADLVVKLVDFPNVSRLMERISKKSESGKKLRESEEWFQKKVMLLSMSHPLPNSAATPENESWKSWTDGMKRAIADPDRRWDKAIYERAKVELEAQELRVRTIVASIDPERNSRLANYLFTLSEETRWKINALDEAGSDSGEETLIVRRKLGDGWNDIAAALRETGAGSLLAELFEIQGVKNHPFPQMKAGTAVLKALLTHPQLRRGQKGPDNLSCLHLFTSSVGDGILEGMISAGRKLEGLKEMPGFEYDERLLRVDLRRVPVSSFLGEDETPVEIDWSNISNDRSFSFKSFVLSYIDNDAFLAELLNNPKATHKPGIISIIAQRCRAVRVLSIIANRRDLYTGFANKGVPLKLIMNPAKISLTSLRKFIHVRYVDKSTLQKLSARTGQIREEVRHEIIRYLSTIR